MKCFEKNDILLLVYHCLCWFYNYIDTLDTGKGSVSVASSSGAPTSRRRLSLPEDYGNDVLVVDLEGLSNSQLDALGDVRTALTDQEILEADIGFLTLAERQKRKILKHRQSQRNYQIKMLETKGPEWVKSISFISGLIR